MSIDPLAGDVIVLRPKSDAFLTRIGQDPPATPTAAVTFSTAGITIRVGKTNVSADRGQLPGQAASFAVVSGPPPLERAIAVLDSAGAQIAAIPRSTGPGMLPLWDEIELLTCCQRAGIPLDYVKVDSLEEASRRFPLSYVEPRGRRRGEFRQ